MRLGAAVFVVGLAFVAVTVVPFLFGSDNAPLAVNLLALAAPLGLALALVGLIAQGRDGQRRAAGRLHETECATNADGPVQR